MKIVSWNVNGLRAVDRKGSLAQLITDFNPDVICLQEIKAAEEKLEELNLFYLDWSKFYHSAQRSGYAGTGVWVKNEYLDVEKFERGMGDFKDNEGRVSTIYFANIVLMNIYFPNGGKSVEAYQGKLVFYDYLLKFIGELRAAGKQVIICGDFNIAYAELDLARPRENSRRIGFLPEERAKLGELWTADWVDVYRSFYPEQEGAFTWWSVKTAARERNVGWRLDYFVCDQDCLKQVKKIVHLTEQMGSDHCPVLLEIEI